MIWINSKSWLYFPKDGGLFPKDRHLFLLSSDMIFGQHSDTIFTNKKKRKKRKQQKYKFQHPVRDIHPMRNARILEGRKKLDNEE